jgi:hypothetical protein
VTYLSDHPVSIDGVRLDTLAWGIEAAALRVGNLRPGDTVLSGLDGVAASTGDAREPSSYALSMFVRGTDADGFVPEDRDAWAKLRANLDDLLHLFLRTDSLIRVSEVVESDGVPGTVLDVLPYTEREFYGKVLDTIEPELEAGAIARFGVVFSNPGVYWRDPVPQDFTQVVVSGTQYEVPGLEGASGHLEQPGGRWPEPGQRRRDRHRRHRRHRPGRPVRQPAAPHADQADRRHPHREGEGGGRRVHRGHSPVPADP